MSPQDAEHPNRAELAAGWVPCVPRVMDAFKRAVRTAEGGVFVALAVLVLIFGLLEPASFATTDNVRNVITDASILLILAVAVTFVVITAGIDLSIGSVVAFSEVVSVKVMASVAGIGGAASTAGAAGSGGESGLAAILLGLGAALAAGLAWGALNGVLIAWIRLPPLIATLATLSAALGAAQLLSGGTDVASVPVELVDSVGIGRLAGVPYLVVVAAFVTALGAILLAKTRFGRYTYAIGSNAEAARRSGIKVTGHLFKVYALAGTFYGLAAFLSVARFGTTSIGGHSTDALDAIAAVALGGTSLFGGIGSILGSVFGIFIPSVLENGLVIVGPSAVLAASRCRHRSRGSCRLRPGASPLTAPRIGCSEGSKHGELNNSSVDRRGVGVGDAGRRWLWQR